MTAFDPDLVEVLARTHHVVDCLADAAPGHHWNQRHLDADRRWATRFATALRDHGHTVATFSESQI